METVAELYPDYAEEQKRFVEHALALLSDSSNPAHLARTTPEVHT